MNHEGFGDGHELEAKGREKVVDTILKEEERKPNLENFRSLYGSDVVTKDLETVRRLKEKFESRYNESPEKKRGYKFSAAFERVFKGWAPRLGWFGDKAEIISTSEYDDYVNGVDGVLILNKSEYVGLAIDTTHTGADKIDEKMMRALDHITNEGSVSLKYFEQKNFRGELKETIPVIVGLDDRNANAVIDTLGQVFNLLKQKERTARQNQILKEKIDVLKDHPAQVIFLRQIRAQLEMYQRVLGADQSESKKTTKEHINTILTIIKAIARDKASIELGDLEQDRVLSAINFFCLAQK